MHELSIAVGIVEAVSEQASSRGFARVDAVTILIGELSGVDKGALSFAWELAAAGSVAEGSRLTFRDVGLRVKCPSCGAERTPPSAWQLACPTCPAVPPDIIAGRELHIVALEVPN